VLKAIIYNIYRAIDEKVIGLSFIIHCIERIINYYIFFFKHIVFKLAMRYSSKSHVWTVIQQILFIAHCHYYIIYKVIT